MQPWLRVCCLVAIIAVSAPRTDAAELADELQRQDAVVATAEEKDSLANQVRDDLRVRLQLANARSTAEWQAIQTREDWERLRAKKLEALERSLGRWPDQTPIRIEMTGEVVGDGFRVRNILAESRPGWWVSANVYVPEPLRESMPGIVISHAHHTAKTHGELQDMGMTWARAGCCVIVPDHVGHGERRQHPFASATDYPKPFAVGRQDYYFRYDNAIQLHLVGESLIGWMAWDLTRCADVLLSIKGVDAERLILLGGVAGGGDPAAVAGLLDNRFAAVVPFNFGGPQPETRYPLPEDSERTFDYVGSGGWESTRNLQQSAAGGFLPWMIVGGIAPRRLVYGHEFSWDRERDLVWKRFEKIYGLYERPERLAFTHGRGVLKDQPPTATHCTHIGAPHRVKIHEAFRQWFGIEVTPDSEYSHRIDSDRLRCWTDEARRSLQPKSLSQMTTALADDLVKRLREQKRATSLRVEVQDRWEALLGGLAVERLQEANRRTSDEVAGIHVERWMLKAASGIRIPCVLLRPEKAERHTPVVLAICSQGKTRLLKERSTDIAAIVNVGGMVCLADPRGIGESKLGDSHTRRSSATSHSSTDLMLGTPLLGEQLSDVRLVLHWLRQRSDVGFRPLVVWGESLIPANPESAAFKTPRDDDQALPAVSEPQASLLALLTGLFEEDLDAIYTCGGLVSWHSLLQSHLVLTAHDVVVPRALIAGDMSDLIAVQAPTTQLWLEGLVDGWNRAASESDLAVLRMARPEGRVAATRQGIAKWIKELK